MVRPASLSVIKLYYMKDESAVFRKMQSGDWNSFNRIFEKYSGRLYAYAYAFVGETHTAEDIVQDTFIYLWAKRERIKCADSIYGYLFRSVKNACLNHKVRRRVETRYNVRAKRAFDHVAGDEESIEELHARAMNRILKLPEKCREILIMGYIDGMSYADIAGKMNISVNTVKTQMRRARHKLNLRF